MNISFDEGIAFSQWLENRGLRPPCYMREMVFSSNFVVTNRDTYQIFVEENAGKKFTPGVEIETRRVKNLKIAVDFKKHKKFRVLKHFSGVWYLLGLEKDSGYIKLTTLSAHQMMKLLGEYFEEEYYTKIFKK
jgi:hypothetical protein